MGFQCSPYKLKTKKDHQSETPACFFLKIRSNNMRVHFTRNVYNYYLCQYPFEGFATHTYVSNEIVFRSFCTLWKQEHVSLDHNNNVPHGWDNVPLFEADPPSSLPSNFAKYWKYVINMCPVEEVDRRFPNWAGGFSVRDIGHLQVSSRPYAPLLASKWLKGCWNAHETPRSYITTPPNKASPNKVPPPK